MLFESSFSDAASTPDARYGDLLSNFYWHQLDRYASNTLMVDYESGRQWTGAAIKRQARRVAAYLVDELLLRPPSASCVMFYKNNDQLQFISMGALFAGAATCVGYVGDPAHEHAHMVNSMEPAVVFCDGSIIDQVLEIRQSSQLNFTICIINDDDGKQVDHKDLPEFVIGYQRDICAYDDQRQGGSELPVQVDPHEAAYVLMTSGSTGLPKPVIRSHRNSIYVAHSLAGDSGRRLWPLDADCVFAGFQELDHGTGTFAIKQTLIHGFKLIVMDGYSERSLLDAITKFQVTDMMLGSAYLHNLMANWVAAGGGKSLGEHKLSSLRNIISIGSALPSPELKRQFMDRLPGLSIRGGYGMTEAGFVSLVPREEALSNGLPPSVGFLLPHTTVKLVNPETGSQVGAFDCEGELYVRSPQVSPGYVGRRLAEQSRAAFLPDGFYRTNDICSISAGGRLRVRGRRQEVLCLTDGWKVLPGELESMLLKHPLIREAVVIGVPDEDLPGNQKPRAYVVPVGGTSGGQLTEQQVKEHVAKLVSLPKQLRGGVRLMDELPRLALGKVDRRALRKMDGY